MHEIVLTEHEAGQRLDRYLRKLLRAMPLSAIFRHLRGGDIKVDGKKADGSLRTRAGMKLQLRLPANDLEAVAGALLQASSQAPPAPLVAKAVSGPSPRIVRRDPHFVVISKPAGLATQPGSGQQDDVTAWLHRQRLGVRTATFVPAPAHRLDRGTSGLLAIGLTPDGLRGLTAAFRDDQVDKVYMAVVHGIPKLAHGTLTWPIMELPAENGLQPRMVCDDRGQAARTEYEVMQTGRHLALLRVRLHTGRRHQIRVHLAHLGHTIVGDSRYGSIADTGRGFLLHCTELAFPHPIGGERVVCTEPPPAEFRATVGRD